MNYITTLDLKVSMKANQSRSSPFCSQDSIWYHCLSWFPRLLPQIAYLVEDPLILNNFIWLYKNSAMKWNMGTHKKHATCIYLHALQMNMDISSSQVVKPMETSTLLGGNQPMRQGINDSHPYNSCLLARGSDHPSSRMAPLGISLTSIWTNKHSGLSETVWKSPW